MLILKAVSLKPLHGYGVLLRIRQISGDALEIPQGSLYPALYRLEHQDLIAAEWGQSENNRRAKYYTLTAGRPPPSARGDGGLEPAGVCDCRGLEHDVRRRCDMFKRFRSSFRVLASRRDFEDGMTEELRFHIEQYTDDLVRSGVPAEEAARRARMEFGGLNSVKEDCREARGLQLFDELGQGPALRRPAAAKDARIHGHRPSDPRALPRRESDDLRGDRLGAAPSAAVSRRRPAGDRVQHLSESRRRPRWLLADQLLRTPRSHCRFQLARDLPLRHGDCRRGGRNGARTDHASVSGFFLDSGARAR